MDAKQSKSVIYMSEEIVVIESRHPVKGWKAVKETHKNGFPSEVSKRKTLFEEANLSIKEMEEKLSSEYGVDSHQMAVGM